MVLRRVGCLCTVVYWNCFQVAGSIPLLPSISTSPFQIDLEGWSLISPQLFWFLFCVCVCVCSRWFKTGSLITVCVFGWTCLWTQFKNPLAQYPRWTTLVPWNVFIFSQYGLFCSCELHLRNILLFYSLKLRILLQFFTSPFFFILSQNCLSSLSLFSSPFSLLFPDVKKQYIGLLLSMLVPIQCLPNEALLLAALWITLLLTPLNPWQSSWE